MNSGADFERQLAKEVDALKANLGANLYSCVLYGSAVQGTFVPGVSDVNLLLVLNESTPEAHAAISDVVRGSRSEPFILGRRGLERSFRAFAIKFRSIQRNYRVLHGADPLADLRIPEETLRFECEQLLRNLRLRTVHALVTFGSKRERYSRYVVNVTRDAFVILSDPLRLEGIDVPADLRERIPVFESTFGTSASILNELSDLKERPRVLSDKEIADCHGRLFRLLDAATVWMESRWTQ